MTESPYQSRLTDIGRAKDSNSLLGDSGLRFKYFVVGDGEGSLSLSSNRLQNEVWRGPVETIRLADAANGIVEISGHIPPDAGNFWIREMGLIDEDGDLVVITKTATTQRLDPSLLQLTEQPLIIRCKSVNPDDVQLIMDPTVIKASRAWTEERILPAYLMACVNAIEIDKIKHP